MSKHKVGHGGKTLLVPKGTPYVARANGIYIPLLLTPITRQFAREIVCGFPERVAPVKSPDVIFIVNEDGHAEGRPPNLHGSYLYGGPIVGDIIVIPRSDPRHKEWL